MAVQTEEDGTDLGDELGLAMIAIMRCILLGMRICTGAILRKSGPIGGSEGIACLG